MAAPTIEFFNAPAGTDSSLVSVFMPKLHELLLLAGWTIEYADADAIGGGNSGNPAWDKVPSSNGDAGVAVYRMPANDHATRWFVRLRPGWGANANRPYIRGVTVGTTHNGTGGVTGGGAETALSDNGLQSDNVSILMSVSQDGFFLQLSRPAGTFPPTALVERVRRVDTGAVTDGVAVLIAFNVVASNLVRTGVGSVHTEAPVALTPMSGAPSLANYDNSEIPLLGPFWVRGRPFYTGRLAYLLSTTDHPLGSEPVLTIDGAPRTYKVAATAWVGATAWGAAQE